MTKSELSTILQNEFDANAEELTAIAQDVLGLSFEQKEFGGGYQATLLGSYYDIGTSNQAIAIEAFARRWALIAEAMNQAFFNYLQDWLVKNKLTLS